MQIRPPASQRRGAEWTRHRLLRQYQGKDKQTNSSSSSLIVCFFSFFSCTAEFQHGRPRERSGEEGSEKGSLDVPNDPLRWSCNWRSVLFGRGLVVVDGRLEEEEEEAKKELGM
jgi:hypothetical protein